MKFLANFLAVVIVFILMLVAGFLTVGLPILLFIILAKLFPLWGALALTLLPYALIIAAIETAAE